MDVSKIDIEKRILQYNDMAIILLRENKRCDEQLAQRLLYYYFVIFCFCAFIKSAKNENSFVNTRSSCQSAKRNTRYCGTDNAVEKTFAERKVVCATLFPSSNFHYVASLLPAF